MSRFLFQKLPRLECTWTSGADFLAQLVAGNDRPGSFFCPAPQTRAPAEKADPEAIYSVIIRFLDRDISFHVHARPVERRAGDQGPGLRLEFLSEEKSRQELVLAAAQGQDVPYVRRRFQRVPCQLSVSVTGGPLRRHEMVGTDVSEGGIMLTPNPVLPVTTYVEMAINFPERVRPLIVQGEVMAVIPEGPQRGLGVQFRFESPQQCGELAAEVERLRALADAARG